MPFADAEPHFLGVDLGGLSYQDQLNPPGCLVYLPLQKPKQLAHFNNKIINLQDYVDTCGNVKTKEKFDNNQ